MSHDWFTRAFKALDDQPLLHKTITELTTLLNTALKERDELRSEHGPRVTQLFEAIAERDQLRAELAVAVAERDEKIAEFELQLRISRRSNKDLRESAERAEARLAAIDNALTVAWLSTDCIGERYLCFSTPDDSDPVVELIARPAKEAPPVTRPKFVRGEICGCQTRPTHYVGEIDCPWHKRGDGQPKEAT